jgi:hypothetical protein
MPFCTTPTAACVARAREREVWERAGEREKRERGVREGWREGEERERCERGLERGRREREVWERARRVRAGERVMWVREGWERARWEGERENAYLQRREVRVRHLAGQELPQRDGEAVDVHGVVVRLVLDHLRRHPPAAIQ